MFLKRLPRCSFTVLGCSAVSWSRSQAERVRRSRQRVLLAIPPNEDNRVAMPFDFSEFRLRDLRHLVSCVFTDPIGMVSQVYIFVSCMCEGMTQYCLVREKPTSSEKARYARTTRSRPRTPGRCRLRLGRGRSSSWSSMLPRLRLQAVADLGDVEEVVVAVVAATILS